MCANDIDGVGGRVGIVEKAQEGAGDGAREAESFGDENRDGSVERRDVIDVESHSRPRSTSDSVIPFAFRPESEEAAAVVDSDHCLPQAHTIAPSQSQGQSQREILSISTRSTTPSAPRRAQLTMPGLADLSSLTLHSPSSQIVGTPFATTSTPFEYPFPETPSACPPSSSSSSFAANASQHLHHQHGHGHGHSPQMQMNMAMAMNTHLPPPLASESSFPAISTSASTSQISPPFLSYPLSLSYPLFSASPASSSASFSASASASASTSSSTSSTPSHPKLKTHIVPPIPPSLVKKRTRWSLSLLGRRRSSVGSAGSVGSGSSGVGSGGSEEGGFFGPMVATPLGSPREERGMH